MCTQYKGAVRDLSSAGENNVLLKCILTYYTGFIDIAFEKI